MGLNLERGAPHIVAWVTALVGGLTKLTLLILYHQGNVSQISFYWDFFNISMIILVIYCVLLVSGLTLCPGRGNQGRLGIQPPLICGEFF